MQNKYSTSRCRHLLRAQRSRIKRELWLAPLSAPVNQSSAGERCIAPLQSGASFARNTPLQVAPPRLPQKLRHVLIARHYDLDFARVKFTHFGTARRYKICHKKRCDTKFRIADAVIKLPSQHDLASLNVASQYKILSHDAAFHIKISPRGNASVKNAIRCARQRARIPPRHNIAAAIITNCYTRSGAEFYLDNLAA